VNLAVILNEDPPVGKIGLIRVLSLDRLTVYARLFASPSPKVKSPVK